MKKLLFAVVLLLALTTLLSGMVLADTAADLDETQIMRSPQGAHVRLNQLDYSLERNIAMGERVLAYLENASNVTNTSTMSELETILDKLQELKLTVENYEVPEEYSADVALEYVAIKEDARELAKSFREIVHPLIDEDARETIRDSFERSERGMKEKHQEQFNGLRNMYNSHQAKEFLGRFNKTDAPFFRAIENGELDMDEMRLRLREHVENCSPETRQDGYRRMHEDRSRNAVHQQYVADHRPDFKLQHHLHEPEGMHSPRAGR